MPCTPASSPKHTSTKHSPPTPNPNGRQNHHRIMRLGVWPLSVLLCRDCGVCINRGCCRLGNGDISACG